MHRSLCLSLKRQALPFVIFALALLPWSSAFAARVAKVKGKSVLIEIESSTIQEGQKYFIMIDGKKKGVVLITKVKGDKALGKLTKGKAEVDAGVEPTKKVADSDDSNSGGSDGDLAPKKKKKKSGGSASSGANSNSGTYIGALVGYAMDSQSVPDTAGATVPMTGSGYSLKGFADMPFSRYFGLIARAGIEQFNLTGNSTTMGSVTTSIMYATADGLLRVNILDGNFVPFLAAGLGIHFPLSKSSGILNVSQISTTTVFFFDGGADYSISDTTYITAHAEYGYFPPSNNISTNFIAIRGGVGFRY